MRSPRRIVLGLGNPDRGDDGAGRAVARCLRGTLPPGVEIVEHDGDAAALLDRLAGAAMAFLVDACASGERAGTVRRIDVGTAPLPHGTFGLSTHGLGLAEAIEIARVLALLPPRCVVYAVEGASFEAGAALSPPVAAAVAGVAVRLRAEIEGAVDWQCEPGRLGPDEYQAKVQAGPVPADTQPSAQ